MKSKDLSHRTPFELMDHRLSSLRTLGWLLLIGSCMNVWPARAGQPRELGLAVHWQDGLLTVTGEFPGRQVEILYLEAYCRPGSTDRDWGETVIRHETDIVSSSPDGKALRLRDRLRDGVVVDHRIAASGDEIEFHLVAHNPTARASAADWAQPCVRVASFTGCEPDSGRTLVPDYARKSFVFLDGRLTRLPTEPWAIEARYTPGQVYRLAGVPREDVNPRPLSTLTPSASLFGVRMCILSDFRIGVLVPDERKTIEGRLYFLPAEPEGLLARYREDFPDD